MKTQALDRLNSRRHVSKTHGSHNARWHSFPHYQDFLDRPVPLPDPDPHRLNSRVNKCRVRHPRTTSRDGIGTGQGRWDFGGTHRIYIVSAPRAHDGVIIHVKVTARCDEEAASIGRELLVMESRSSVLKVTVKDVTGETTPPAATSVDHNPWVSNK